MRRIPGVSLHWPAETKAQLLAAPGQSKVDAWRRSHKARGWRDIGYHYIVHRDQSGLPQIYDGRSDAIPGAHSGTNAGNRFLGINVAYGMDETVPDGIFIALAQLIADLSKAYGFPINRSTIKGHREFIATQCPGNALFSRLDELIDTANKLKSNRAPVQQDEPEPLPEEQIHPAFLSIEQNGSVRTVDAVLINSQLFVYVPHIGPTTWDGETKTGTVKL